MPPAVDAKLPNLLEVPEDERDKGKTKMQDLLKAYENKIDSLANAKEKEVMEK